MGHLSIEYSFPEFKCINLAGLRVIKISFSSVGPPLLIIKSTSDSLDLGSLSGPAGKANPFPSLLAPSITAISISLPIA